MRTKGKNYWTWAGLRCLEFIGRLRRAIVLPEDWVKTNKTIEIGGFIIACLLIIGLTYALVAVLYVWIMYLISPEVRAIFLFALIMGTYLFASNRFRRIQGLFIRSNLAVINILGALFFAACSIMALNNYFTPIFQTIFNWPGLIVFAILTTYGWLDFREYIFLRRLRGPGNLIYHVLPKLGLICILLCLMTMILFEALKPQYKTTNFILAVELLSLTGLLFWSVSAFLWTKISVKKTF